MSETITYHDWKMDALMREAKDRKIDFPENISREDLITLLQNDGEAPVEQEPKIPGEPQQAKMVKGKNKYRRKSDGEIYELELRAADPITGRTHKCVNKIHTWEGTEAQFCRDFVRADGTALMPSN